MSDVASRLLAAIDERVRKAEACIAEVGSDRVGDEYADGSGTAERDDFPSYPWGSADAELAFMAEPGHPASVLRLCEAHGEIVARYEHARKRSQTAPEPERILWHTRTIALIDVMDALVRGYGVEDGEDR